MSGAPITISSDFASLRAKLSKDGFDITRKPAGSNLCRVYFIVARDKDAYRDIKNIEITFCDTHGLTRIRTFENAEGKVVRELVLRGKSGLADEAMNQFPWRLDNGCIPNDTAFAGDYRYADEGTRPCAE